MHLFRIPCATLAIFMLLAAPSALCAQASRPEAAGLRPDAPTYAKHGPYWVGTRDLVIPVAAAGISLPATLWYPAQNPGGAKEACNYAADTRQMAAAASGLTATLTGSALRDAPPDASAQPCPFVVFSSDNPRTRVMYARLLEHLASYGFAVLGVDHVPDIYTRRPKDIMEVIDFALRPGALSMAADAQRIALAGAGEGAKTVMNVGGVSFSRNQMDPCDPRVKAVISLGMQGSTAFMNPDRATYPMLFLNGSQDIYRAVPDMEEIYQAMPAVQKALVVLAGGGGDMFADPSLKPLWPLWNWGSLDLDRAQDLANHFTTAFLLDVFKGDKAAHQALLPGAGKFEEVQYTTTWK